MPLLLVTFFTKHGCHLCNEVEELLDEAQQIFPLRVRRVEITHDPVTFETYRYTIPVVAISGGPTLAGPIERSRLTRAVQETIGLDRS